jgi:hypothetical protein
MHTDTLKRFLLTSFIALTFTLPFAATTNASIIFTNTQVNESGTGFGNVLTVLAVKQSGNDTTEFGSVLWNGASDVLSTAENQSQTRTVTELLAAGVNAGNLQIIFNVNEGGDADPVLTLHDFSIVFQNAAGAELFRETYDSTGGTPLGAAGTGNGSSGWRFTVNFTANAAAAALFFGTTTNRIGMEIVGDEAIENVKGSAESFFVTAPVAAPEPSAGLLSLLGLGLVATRYRRRIGR